jgi:hypothetical protein
MDEEEIFALALEKSEPIDRAAFLESACAGDAALRERIEALLRADAAAGSFLERPAPVPGAETIDSGAEENAARPESPLGQTVRYVGDYELLEEIARGGMGVVFRARQASLNRVVALKMMLKGEFAAEADVRRFRQEAESAATLDHPNIVPIYEVGEHEGHQYFSMKLIETPASSVPAAGDSFRDTAIRLVKVARAVHHAHQRGVLHRDLKPGNILIDRQGEPHVADFGLARKVDRSEDATRSGLIVGTPNYMAPEQAGAEKSLTTAVDVWSLGVVLYEWLTGQVPFRGDDVVSTLMKVSTDDPASPRSLVSRIPRDLETICLKCLNKSPAARYRSAEDLADDLERWLRGEPIAARRISTRERVVKWARRRPALAGLLAVSVLAALTLSAAGWHYSARLAEQNETLTEERDRARIAAEKEAAANDQLKVEKRKTEDERDRAAFQTFRLESWKDAVELEDCLRYWEDRDLDKADWAFMPPKHKFRDTWEHYHIADLLKRTVRRVSGPCDIMALSADGRRLVATDAGNSTSLWDLTTEKSSKLIGPGKGPAWTSSVGISADGTRCVAIAAGSISVWNCDTGAVTASFTHDHDKAQRNEAGYVAISANGKRVVSSGGKYKGKGVLNRRRPPRRPHHDQGVERGFRNARTHLSAQRQMGLPRRHRCRGQAHCERGLRLRQQSGCETLECRDGRASAHLPGTERRRCPCRHEPRRQANLSRRLHDDVGRGFGQGPFRPHRP